jgi:hypothetical protein
MTWHQNPGGHTLTQKRIVDYFKPLGLEKKQPCAPSIRTGLLDLPRHVFRIIMQHLCADMIRDCAFLLNQNPSVEDFADADGNLADELKPGWSGIWRDALEENRFTQWGEICAKSTYSRSYCECPAMSWQFCALLTCCRAFWLELTPLVYAQNSFVVHRCAQNGMLGPLKSIGSTNLAALTSLKIVVNSALPTCTSFFDRVNWMRENGGQRYCDCYCNDLVPRETLNGYEFCLCEGVDRPFAQYMTGRGRRALIELRKVVELLKSLIKPGQLELGIVCDCKDLPTASTFANTLHGLPRLRSCALRLSVANDKSIRTLATQTVRKLTGKDQPLILSGFAQLSQELRTRILEFTDLVAPADIEYSPRWPQGGLNLQFHRQRKPHLCQFVSGWNIGLISFARYCACWTFPRSLFLVNKEFHKEAIRIFYSQNHFIALPLTERYHHLDEADVREFRGYFHLPRWTPSALRWLRSIQISFPLDTHFLTTAVYSDDYDVMEQVMFWEYPDEYEGWIRNQSAAGYISRSQVEYWGDRLVKMLQGVPLNMLELTLDFHSLQNIREWFGPRNEYLAALEDMLKRVADTVAIVNKHGTGGKGFSKLFIHVPNGIGEDIAQKLEKMVMGEHYDSLSEGKFLFPNRFEYWADYLEREWGYVVQD